MTTTSQTTFITVDIKMRLGSREDFRVEDTFINSSGLLETKYNPKYGQPYWLKSVKTGEFDNRNYFLSEDTDFSEFKTQLQLKMVYIAASYFELKEAGLL